MSYRYNIRFSGAGGYGLVQAARILAEAAAIYDNKNAVETFSYGPEARGSACRAEIVISDEVIDYPRVDLVDFLLALTQEAFDKYAEELLPDGVIVIDSHIEFFKKINAGKILTVPFMEIAERECGQPSLINIVALGFFARVNQIISAQAIRQAILARIPKKSELIYIKAFEAGLDAAKRLENGQIHGASQAVS
jgi:2-oxoglutarate ferredoxin oxidoreductase subunit gamma